MYDYIDKYGSKTFKEEPLNEIDLMIFSSLAYANFTGLIDDSGKKVALKDVAELYFYANDKKAIKNNIVGVSGGIKVFKYISEFPRYSNLKLYNHRNILNDVEQFSGLFIDIDSRTTVVAFQGTTDLICGWKEDSELCYNFPTRAQSDAIKLVNDNISIFNHRRYIFVGHSKGGNLALSAAMKLKWSKRLCLKKVYSLDGPGLRLDEFTGKDYKKIEKKYTLILPNYSVVGILLNNKVNCKVIKSTKHSAYAHHMNTWVVKDNKLVESELSSFSLTIKKTVDNWLNKYDYETLRVLNDDLFNVMTEADIYTLMDIKRVKILKIRNALKASKNITQESKDKLKEFIEILLDNVFSTDKDE